jgi:hypothetical protein
MDEIWEAERQELEDTIRGIIERVEGEGIEGFAGMVLVGETQKEAYERRVKKSTKLLADVERMKDKL